MSEPLILLNGCEKTIRRKEVAQVVFYFTPHIIILAVTCLYLVCYVFEAG